MKHIPQTQIDEARDALRGGRRLEDIAGQMGVSPEYLARLLELPRLQPVPDDDEESFCLFAGAERLDAVL